MKNIIALFAILGFVSVANANETAPEAAQEAHTTAPAEGHAKAEHHAAKKQIKKAKKGKKAEKAAEHEEAPAAEAPAHH